MTARTKTFLVLLLRHLKGAVKALEALLANGTEPGD